MNYYLFGTMPENIPTPIDSVIENLMSLYPLLSKNLTRSIRSKTNLNPGSLFVLAILMKHEVLSMSEIGCRLSMPKPHVTAHIDKLVAEEMVERLFDPKDRRVVNVRPTPKGIADFRKIKDEISREMRQRIEKLDPTTFRQLHESSLVVKNILSDIMDDGGATLCSKNKE
ncbi:MAG TPA: MarR family transcriptional regulator [Paludibacter sp.]|nr:MarR family transcriptional regulator [Paludibacter sp.]